MKNIPVPEKPIKENGVKMKIIMEGEREYREALSKMREETKEFRKEVEKLNTALEKETELLKGLK